ncbi:hypothetical protein [Desulfitobacterium sp.]|uniref:hypothetical protein n=1 Tax=Desulfitobacterium sp. TaxID=49981 RepID=UPI002B515172|nr:hypothetical protein [Desulfitobacterium sp.]HVJ48901.1 hypothetical protein [Desulfitobacterium sp.]
MLGVENHYLKYLGVVGGALFLTGMIYWPLYGNVQELKVEKHYWQAQVELPRPVAQSANLPKLLDFPTTIEECQRLFQEGNVQVLAVNLDRIEAERRNPTSTDQLSGLSYALFHFKLKGSWGGIETGFQRLENISNQAIQIQEVRLNPEGGDAILKIYFYEPDKPILP